jgi:hypothetical protein
VPLWIATVTRVLLSVVTRFPYRSPITTTGCPISVAPLAPPTGCVVITNCVATPAVPVAVKVTGEPVSPATVAVSVFAPTVVPKVQAGLVAIPALSVTTAPEDTNEPPPLPTAKVTGTPLTALPCASVTTTEGAVATAVPTVALCGFPDRTAIRAAAPATPVAVKVTGEPLNPVAVAVSVFAPTVVPKVQAGLVAIPPLSVITAPEDANEPPPLPTAKVTGTPLTALPCASVTTTEGAVATAVLTVALCRSPDRTAIRVAAPATPVAVKVTGEPLNPVAVAVNRFGPAVVPKVQVGLVAIPPLSVITALEEATEPPPSPTAKVTGTPLTALPCPSVTTTEGAVPTAVPTVARCRLPPFMAMRVATPEATVTGCDSTAVSAGSALNLST